MAVTGAAIFGFIAKTVVGMAVSWVVNALFGEDPLGSLGDSTNYAFGPISNTKSQVLPVPVVYGKCRVAGNIFMQLFDDSTRTNEDLFIGLSEGPISQVIRVSVDDNVLYGDGADVGVKYLVYQQSEQGGMAWQEVQASYYEAYTGQKKMENSAGEEITMDLQDCTIDIHLGEDDQPIDTREPGAYYYPNTAYIALSLKAQNGLSGNPTITSLIEGRLVPVGGGTPQFSRNPAWIVYDYLTSKRYGAGIDAATIDLGSFQSVANYCDQMVDGVPRFQLDYIIDTQRPHSEHLKTMLQTFGGYISFDSGMVVLSCDRDVSTYSRAVTGNQIIDGSFAWWVAPDETRYNRVIIEWIDPDLSYERSSAIFEDTASIAAEGIKDISISMLGVTTPEQVGRLGAKSLYEARNIRNFCSFTCSWNGMDIDVGDVISLTFEGWTNKWFKVRSIIDKGDWTFDISCVEYDGLTYSQGSAVFDRGDVHENTAPSLSDVSNLVLSMQPRINTDGSYIPDVLATWRLPNSFEPSEVQLRWWYTDTPNDIAAITLAADATEYLIPNLTALLTVVVNVRVKIPQGTYTTGYTAQLLLDRDVLAPGKPTNLQAEGWFGFVNLWWTNPVDDDLAGIEVWCSEMEGVLSTDPEFEQKATMLGRVMASEYVHQVSTAGTRWYWVRAVDTSGNKSDFNLPQGTPGTSMLGAEEVLEWQLMQPHVQELLDEINDPIPDIRSDIENALSQWEDVKQKVADQIAAKAQAEAELEGGVTQWEGWKYHNAINLEQKTMIEEQGRVLSEDIRGVAAMIGDPDNPSEDTVFAAVRDVMRALAESDKATAERIQSLTAYIGNPEDEEGTIWGAINTAEKATATLEESTTERIDQLGSEFNNSFAGIQTTLNTHTNSISSQARATQTLQSELNGAKSSIQVVANTVDGITSSYVVKTDSGGVVAGYGIINQGARRNAIVFQTDLFQVVPASGARVSPFSVGYRQDGSYGVTISNLLVGQASIRTAAIQDLSVNTLKIAGRAVTVPYFMSGYATMYGTLNSWVTDASFYLPSVPAGTETMVNLTFQSYDGQDWLTARELANGNIRIVIGGYAYYASGAATMTYDDLGTGAASSGYIGSFATGCNAVSGSPLVQIQHRLHWSSGSGNYVSGNWYASFISCKK